MSKEDISGTHLWLLLWRAYKAAEDVDRESIGKLGFKSLSDFAVLEVLYHKGPQPVNSIGKKVHLTSGSITTAVDRAERAGYVHRVREEDDRRVVTIHLTEKGKLLIEEAFKTHASELEKIFSPLSANERTTLARLLKKAGKHAATLAG